MSDKVNLKQLISQMTIEEKIGQLVQLNGRLLGNTDAAITGPAQKLGIKGDFLKNVGSVLNFKNAGEVEHLLLTKSFWLK